jgi:hypothetical protein
MSASVILRFLFGHAESVRTVAFSRASFWTGVILVLLTAIARNYDQTFILEKPFLWLFGPLLFSVLSGTWVFLVGYAIAWGYMDAERPGFWSAWPAFMGLFWMTAPIAWLYAIPVERLFDSVTAARANVALLTIVSSWRAILMARVFQVLHRAPFLMCLSWVLIPACIEILVLYFFGGGLAKSIMAGMMGMRNSPEEQVLLDAMNVAMTTTPWVLLAATISTVAWRMKASTSPFPVRQPGKVPWPSLGVAAALWIVVAVVPQLQVARNAAVDRLAADGEFRKLLDYLSAHQPHQFAPSRTLPPGPFEREIFEQVPELMRAVKTSDAPWVHEHLILRLSQMSAHFNRRWNAPAIGSAEDQIKSMSENLEWALNYARLNGADFRAILDGLERIPAGKSWVATNQVFLAALAKVAADAPLDGHSGESPEAQRAEWDAVLAHIAKLTDSMGTNLPVANAKPIQ